MRILNHSVAGNSISLSPLNSPRRGASLSAPPPPRAHQLASIHMTGLSELEKQILNDSKENDGKRRRRKSKVSRLREDRPVTDLEILVLRRYPPRLVSSRKWTGRVAAACGRDESGVVGLVLWGDQMMRWRLAISSASRMAGASDASASALYPLGAVANSLCSIPDHSESRS